MEYKFTKEELQTWFMNNQIKESNLDFLTKTICEIKGLQFDKCSNIRIALTVANIKRCNTEVN